jgi:hypothetical protein
VIPWWLGLILLLGGFGVGAAFTGSRDRKKAEDRRQMKRSASVPFQ